MGKSKKGSDKMNNDFKSRFRQRFGQQVVDPMSEEAAPERKQYTNVADKIKDMYAEMQQEVEDKQAALDEYNQENPTTSTLESAKRYFLQQVPLNMQASNIGTAQANIDVPLAGGINKLTPQMLARMKGLTKLAKERGLEPLKEALAPKIAAQIEDVVQRPMDVALKENLMQKQIERIQNIIRENEGVPGAERLLKQANARLVKLKDALARKKFIGDDEI